MDIIKYNKLGSKSLLALPGSHNFIHSSGSPWSFLQITGGRDKTILGEISTWAMEAKMATIEACQASLGEGSDWIKDTTQEDLENKLVRGWTHQKLRKAERVHWLV